MDCPIFVVHYSPLTERKKHITNELNKYNFNFTFEENYNKEDLTSDDLNKFTNIKNLKMAEISLACKHLNLYKKIVENNINYAIIFEDDVTLNDNFKNDLLFYYNQLPDDWDVFFFGSGWNLHVPDNIVKNSDKNVFLKNNHGHGINSEQYKLGWSVCAGSTRCSDSYIITKKAAKKILNYCSSRKIYRPFDLFLNICFRETQMKVYWGEPTLCKQDTFKSSIKCSN